MHRILVACDGSHHCERALQVASDLSRLHSAELFIVSVRGAGGPSTALATMAEVEHTARAEEHTASPNLARVPSWMSDAVDAVHRSDETANIEDFLLAQILERARLDARRRGVEQITLLERAGDAAEEILHCAREIDAEAILVGSRGLGPLRSAILGSVSQKIARGVPDGCICITVASADPTR